MRFDPGLKTGFAEEVMGVDEHGHPTRVINWPLSQAEYEQIRQGHRCLNCMEPFEAAFPESCGVCGFGVRANQSRELARQHQGSHRYGPTPDSVFDDQREREAWVPKTQVLIPGRDF